MKNLAQLTGEALDRAMIEIIQTGTQPPPPAKEKPVWEYAGQVQLEPKPVKVKQTSVMDALAGLVARDKHRFQLAYVYSTGDEAVATDGIVMMVVRGPRIPAGWYATKSSTTLHNGMRKIVEYQMGNASPNIEVYKGILNNMDAIAFGDFNKITKRYPDYNAVIPAKDQTLCRKVQLSDVLAMANAAKQAHKYFVNTVGYVVMLEDGDRYAYVAYQKLYEIARAMMQVGETEVEMQVNGPSRVVVFWGWKATGLVMPLMNSGMYPAMAPYTKL